jgi:sulfite oxidase
MTNGIGRAMGEAVPAQRVRRAGETLAAVRLLQDNPSPANAVAFHVLHARHLREVGDEQAAARADERAEHARHLAALLDPSPRRPLDDEITARTPVQQERAGEATQVQYARAGSERGDAALQRSVEALYRADAYEARAKAGRDRSDAARRRLVAAGARGAASSLRSPLTASEVQVGERADERDRRADEREQVADERERLADERDRRADLRDKIADRRDRTADERDRVAEKQERFNSAFAAARTTPEVRETD